MKKHRTILLALGLVLGGLLSFSALAARDGAAASTWAAEAPRVDGQTDDWAGVARGLDKSVMVEYAFRNNGENLYALLDFKDRKFLSTITATGVTLYFSTEGKKDTDRGVRFIQKTVTADELIATLEKEGRTLTDENKKELRSRTSYVLYDSSIVDGKGNVLGPAVGPGQSVPPAFRFGRSGQETVYEFRVPLQKGGDHPAGIGVAPGQKLKVGFSWGGMTKEMRDAKFAQLSSQGVRATESGGDVNPSSERDETGRGSPSLEAMLRGPKRHTFWVDVTLAAPEAK